MTTRQTLDRAVLRACNKDIRFDGNWTRPRCLEDAAADIAAELGLSTQDVRRCRDIESLCDLIDRGAPASRDSAPSDSPGLF